MRIMKRKTMPTLLVAVIVLLLLPGLACNLFSVELDEIEVIEEPVVIEEPDDKPVFRPEQGLRLDFEDKVESVAYANDGNLIATGISRQADIWRVDDGSLVQSFEVQHSVEGMAFLPGDDAIALGINVWHVYIFDIASGEERLYFDNRGYDHSLALAPDGTRIATGNRDGKTWLWDIGKGTLILEMDPADHIDGYAEWLTALAFAPDGGMIAAGHWDGSIFLWDANNGDLIRMIEPETGFCNAVGMDFSTDGQYLAVGGLRHERDEVIKVFQVSDGSLAWALDDYSRSGTRFAPVAFSPDGTLLAAGTMDGIYIWALPDFELLHTIPIEDTGATDWVTDLAFSPEGRYLLVGYWDNYAILWQVQE